MGMFDYLRCERVMPDGFDGRGQEFQTKDFDCDMVEYRITDDGRLHQPLVDGEPSTRFDGGKANGWREMDFHGWLNFYTYLGVESGKPNGEWHGYLAKFTDGRMVELKCDARTNLTAHSASTDGDG